jgi:single-strand DNA-binding protein
MASNLNSWQGMGRLTRDAVLKQAGQNDLLTFGIAVEGYKDWCNYFTVKVWGKTATAIAQYMTKGKLVIVEGELKQERWEEDGKQRSTIVVVGSIIHFIPTGKVSDRQETVEQRDGALEESRQVPTNDDIPF